MTRDLSVIPTSFYASEDAVFIAKNLLGAIIYTEFQSGMITSGRIVETEAYMAPEDLACHARGNKRTPRTETMFARPGTAYVYKCYGIHDLFNIVTAPEEVAHAVLIRAVEPLEGIAIMSERRRVSAEKVELVNGPGKLTTALGISVAFDGIDVTDESSPLKILDDPDYNSYEIIAGPRVGLSHLTRHCGHYPWRFRIKSNKYTSLPHVVKYNW